MIYSSNNPGVNEAKKCRLESAHCAGLEAQFTHDTKVTQITSDGFYIDQLGYIVHVHGNNETILIGDNIQLTGLWLPDGSVQMHEWHISRQRRWRIYLSLAAVVIVGWYFFGTFRWNFSTMSFHAKEIDA